MYQAIHFSMTILTTWTTKMLFLREFNITIKDLVKNHEIWKVLFPQKLAPYL